MIKNLFARINAQAPPAPQGPLTDAERDELERLRSAMTWIECAARLGKIEIAQSMFRSGFEFCSWQSGRVDVHKVPPRSLLAAIERARAPCARD